MLNRITRLLAFWFFKCFCRLEVKGRDNIPRVGGFILASNHVSFLDPPLVAGACPRQLNFMARDDLFTIPIFGAFIRAAGSFPVRRDSTTIASIKQALRCLQKAEGLLLFPEGGRTFGGLVKRVERGIGFIALKSQAPVVPVFINGSQRALARNARFIKPAKIRVYFGKPIYPTRPMHPVRNFISNGVHPTGRMEERSNGVYPKNSNLKDDYRGFTNRVMQEINRLSQGE